jgi:hypothetical protein
MTAHAAKKKCENKDGKKNVKNDTSLRTLSE